MTAIIKDVMTTRVVALRKAADFKEIVSVLRRYRVSACPVIDDSDRVVGVVSEADLLYKETEPDRPPALLRFQWQLDEEYKSRAVTAGQLMTSPAVTVQPGLPVADAARLMQDRRVKRLPVVNDDGELVGIVTRSDVLAIFERPDPDIYDEVTKVIIGTEFGLDPADFEVRVRSGVVTVEGLVELRRTALDLVRRVQHAEGVVSVRNRLSFGPD
jgi:CBS domain-containing protein